MVKYFVLGEIMKNILLALTQLLILCSTIVAQDSLLRSGPMVGYSEMREVMLWVQTNNTANVKIEYWNKDDSTKKYFTNQVTTEKQTGYTAHLIADVLEHGLRYEYKL